MTSSDEHEEQFKALPKRKIRAHWSSDTKRIWILHQVFNKLEKYNVVVQGWILDKKLCVFGNTEM